MKHAAYDPATALSKPRLVCCNSRRVEWNVSGKKYRKEEQNEKENPM